MKKLLFPFIVIILIVLAVIYVNVKAKKSQLNEPTPIPQQEEAVTPATEDTSTKLCFYKETKTQNGLYDVAWLKMNIDGNNVSGEFRNLPAEKDSKVGTFKGAIDPVYSETTIRTADVWWDSMAEGMHVTEQLKLIFNENVVQAGFSEMIDRGDGVYVYKDPNNIGYWQIMNAADCTDLDDRIVVEKYIRANIKTLAPEKPVLGGTLYATTIHIEPTLKTGTMKYEDGHIQGSATFSYNRNGEEVTISSVKKI